MIPMTRTNIGTFLRQDGLYEGFWRDLHLAMEYLELLDRKSKEEGEWES